MRNMCIGLFVLSLAACASTGTSTSTTQKEGWTEYQAEVMQERDRGELTPLQAEDSMEARYRELYGLDPEMEGAFAYSRELYAQAAVGRLSLSEAEALAKAHEDETLESEAARTKSEDATEYHFPPEASD